MYYVERDDQGRIKGLERWPSDGGSGERLADDNAEVLVFRGERQSPLAVDHVLSGPQFVLALSLLEVDPVALEASLETMPGLTPEQKTYHKARFWRGDRFRRDDTILVAALSKLVADEEAVDSAWMAAKDLAEGETK